MLLKNWEELPEDMRCDEVRKYYDILSRRKASLLLKRLFDIVVSLVLLVVLSPIFLIIAAAVAFDSTGGVFFRQTRVTAYGKRFRIFKFRTMVANAERLGPQVSVNNDMSVTRVGKLLRGCRLDEIPQLLNILNVDMTFVGTRPEVEKYVGGYTPVMRATLLLPAGVTSEASIYFKDESELLAGAEDLDAAYAQEVLPAKMYYNLYAIERFSLVREINTMFKTVLSVLGKRYTGDYQTAKESVLEREAVKR